MRRGGAIRLFLSPNMKALSYMNVLSMDVVLGAISCSLYLGHVWHSPPAWFSVMLLGCVVWLIYTFDHLKDVYGNPVRSGTLRHAFHAQHFTTLILAAVFVLLLSLYLLLQVNERILRLGTGLMVLVGIYFLMLHFLRSNARFHKELVIAVLYAAGVSIPALGSGSMAISTDQWIQVTQLAALALGNLLCFSLYEYQTDLKAGFPSVIQVLKPKTGKRILVIFLLVQVVTCVSMYGLNWHRETSLVFGLMAVVLLLLTVFMQYFRNASWFRLSGDAVFILPMLFYLVT